MRCKNCNDQLSDKFSFCPACGAKIIKNRLTFKNLWEDFSERFLNVDNTFFRTFIHLFTKPEMVIGGFINGVRKKYLNPLGYFAFSVVLSGVMFYILKKVYHISLMPKEASFMEKVYEYEAFMTYFAIPAYTIASFILFIDKNKYNFTEHFIINIYWLAQFTIVQSVLFIFVFGIFDIEFSVFSNFFVVPVVLYMLYLLKRLYSMSTKKIILRGLLYLPMYFIATTSVIIPVIIYLFAIGEFNLVDFVSKK